MRHESSEKLVVAVQYELHQMVDEMTNPGMGALHILKAIESRCQERYRDIERIIGNERAAESQLRQMSRKRNIVFQPAPGAESGGEG